METRNQPGTKPRRDSENCIYADPTEAAPAVKHCWWCDAPLCSFCGARDKADRVYCNECFNLLSDVTSLDNQSGGER